MRTLYGFGLALGGLCLLAGCDLAPKYNQPVVDIPQNFKEVGDWQPATPSNTLPRGPWWKQYNDSLLDQYEDQVESANPDLAAAVAHYDSARDYAAEINSVLFPQVGVGADTSGNRQSVNAPLRGLKSVNPTQYSVNEGYGQANYEVDLWYQLHNEVLAGEANAQSIAAQLADVQLSLQAQTADAYILLRGLDAETELLDQTVKQYAKGVEIEQDRYAGHIDSGLALVRAKTQYDLVRGLETNNIAQRALVEHSIAALVGQVASNFAIKPAVVTLTLPKIPTGVPSNLLQRRPDIASAERQVAMANYDIGVTKAAFYPTLSISAVGGLQNSNGSALNLLSLPLAIWSIGPSTFLPLFEGGLRHAAEARSYARWHEAISVYRSTVLTAFQHVEDNLSLLNNLGLEVQQLEAAIDDANRTLQLSNAMYEAGAVNYLDVVVAEAQFLDSQQQAISAQTRRLQASVDLIRGLGGGWSSDQLPGSQQSKQRNGFN
jgi:NodT family efflux transporter outer membrane factor (OMF) lipoprotein